MGNMTKRHPSGIQGPQNSSMVADQNSQSNKNSEKGFIDQKMKKEVVNAAEK